MPRIHPDRAVYRSPAMLVQLSDLHVTVADGATGAFERLKRAVLRVAALDPRPVAVLLSGDLVDSPSRRAYDLVHAALLALDVPLHAIPGNHDDRDMLRARFGPASEGVGDPVNFAVDCGPLRLIGLDSTVPGSEAGALGGEQLGWLEQTLAQDRERATLLALHHPPVLTGVGSMDAIALAAEDRVALEELISRSPQVRAITCGHVHATMTTAFAGRSLLICPSTNSVLRLDLRERTDLPFAVAAQPLGFAVHALIDGRLVSHVQPLDRPHTS